MVIMVAAPAQGGGHAAAGLVWLLGAAVLVAAVAIVYLLRRVVVLSAEVRRHAGVERVARARSAREALRFRTVLDQMVDLVVLVSEDGRVELSNAAARRLLGPRLEDVPVHDWPAAFRVETMGGQPYDPAEFPPVRALEGERTEHVDLVLFAADGTRRYLSGSAAPLSRRHGGGTGAAMVFRDVTEEHHYAEMLRHSNRELRRQAEVLEETNTRLRDATAARDQFLAVMSHELRTPINAILGYTELLEMGVKGELNAEQRIMLGRVQDTTRRLLGLINGVLDLAKIGAGHIDMVLGELDLSELVARVVEEVRPTAEGKGLALHLAAPAEGPPVVAVADETRLTQIVMNLLLNAVKFTHAGEVRTVVEKSGGQARIRVRDSGPGIPPDQLERIFEAFYQVEGGLARSSDGSGLGLAVARRFARLMGGDVRVHSRVGAGSEFVVELPAPDRPTRVDRDEDVIVVLCADAALRDSLEQQLRGRGRLLCAADAAGVAALARREEPGLVVLDAHAPDLAAWRALGALLSDPRTADARVAPLGFPPGRPATTLDLGSFHVLARPLDLDRVVEQVRRESHEGGRVLVCGHDMDERRILSETLAAAGFNVSTTGSPRDAFNRVEAEQTDVLIVDLLIADGGGLELIARLRARGVVGRTAVIAIGAAEPSAQEMAMLRDGLERIERLPGLRLRPAAAIVAEAADFEARLRAPRMTSP